MSNYDENNMQSNGDHDMAGNRIFTDNNTNDTCYEDSYGEFHKMSGSTSYDDANNDNNDNWQESSRESNEDDSEPGTTNIQNNHDDRFIKGTSYPRQIELATHNKSSAASDFIDGVIGVITTAVVVGLLYYFFGR